MLRFDDVSQRSSRGSSYVILISLFSLPPRQDFIFLVFSFLVTQHLFFKGSLRWYLIHQRREKRVISSNFKRIYIYIKKRRKQYCRQSGFCCHPSLHHYPSFRSGIQLLSLSSFYNRRTKYGVHQPRIRDLRIEETGFYLDIGSKILLEKKTFRRKHWPENLQETFSPPSILHCVSPN